MVSHSDQIIVGSLFHAIFKIFAKKISVAQQFSSPYFPHQNGIAERYWRTIFENVRDL